MDRSLKTCRVCGKQYKPCRPRYAGDSIYRWQDVACCAEHGAQYFEMALSAESAAKAAEDNTPQDVAISDADVASVETDAVAAEVGSEDGNGERRTEDITARKPTARRRKRSQESQEE